MNGMPKSFKLVSGHMFFILPFFAGSAVEILMLRYHRN